MDCHSVCVFYRLLCISVGLRSVCVCVRDCYAFHSVCVMPPVKLRGAQRSTFRLQLTTRDTDLSSPEDDPTRCDSQSSAQLRTLRLRKVLSDISCLTINISGSDPNRSSFLDCNNQLHHPLKLSIID